MLIAGLLGGAGAAAAAEPEVYYGYARDRESGDYLYTERHSRVARDGRWLRATIEYFGPDGRRIGVKTMDFSEHPYVPIYTLELASGYREGIVAVEGDRIRMFRQQAGEARVEQTLRLDPPMAADSGFHGFIVERLDRLIRGRMARFDFGVAGSLEGYSFRVRKIDDTLFEGEPAVLLRVESATLLRFVAPSLELVYDPDSGRLLEYRGISNLRDPDTGRNYRDVRVSYSSEPPPEARSAPGVALK